MIKSPLNPINLKTEPTVSSPAAKTNLNDPAANVLATCDLHSIFNRLAVRVQGETNDIPDGGVIVAWGLDFPLKYCSGRVTMIIWFARRNAMVLNKKDTV